MLPVRYFAALVEVSPHGREIRQTVRSIERLQKAQGHADPHSPARFMLEGFRLGKRYAGKSRRGEKHAVRTSRSPLHEHGARTVHLKVYIFLRALGIAGQEGFQAAIGIYGLVIMQVAGLVTVILLAP